MISSVSFGSESFENLVAKEPANASTSTKPSAASGMYDDDRFERSGSSFTKKAVITVGALAVIAGALALLRGKVETLKNIDVVNGAMKDQEGFTAKAKFVIAKAGQKVIDWSKAVWSHIPFVGKKGQDAVEKTGEKA